MTTRRKILLATCTTLLAAPRWSAAQTAGRSYRVGLMSSTDSFKEPYSLAFVQRLAELGFVEGRNLTLERRHSAGNLERLPALSAEIGKLNCDA